MHDMENDGPQSDDAAEIDAKQPGDGSPSPLSPEEATKLARARRRAIRTALAILIASPTLIIAALLRTNPYIPPGHEGYIYERPRIFGHGGFLGTVNGPGNFGLSFFRNESINIDMLPQTYTEVFNVLAQDDLTISFKFHAVISVEPGSVIRIVNEYGGVDWYARYVKETFRSIVRDAVQQHKSTEIKMAMPSFADAVQVGLQDYLTNTPFKLVSLVVGDIDYPGSVAQAVERKLAAQQLLEEKDTQTQIAVKDSQIEIERAKGQAEAQKIINSTLTDRYLQHEAIETQAKMASSPNNTTIYIPLGPTGMPLVYSPSNAR